MAIRKTEIDGKEVLLLEMGKGDVGIYQGSKNNPILMFKNIPRQEKENWTNDSGEDFEGAEKSEFMIGIGFSDPLSITNFIDALIETQKKLLT